MSDRVGDGKFSACKARCGQHSGGGRVGRRSGNPRQPDRSRPSVGHTDIRLATNRARRSGPMLVKRNNHTAKNPTGQWTLPKLPR